MSRLWKIAGITALVAVLAVSAVALVSAQGPQAGKGNQGVNLWDRMRERGLDGFGSWGMMRGGRFGGRGFGMGGSGNSLISVAAEKLGMTVEQLVDELEADKTIADVAKAKGVEPKTIVDAFVAPRAEYMAELIADGRITQAQADEMLAHMREEAEQHLEEAYPLSCDGECGEYMSEGFGGCGRWGGTSGSVAPNRFPGMMERRTF
jgi:hypothetical protein